MKMPESGADASGRLVPKLLLGNGRHRSSASGRDQTTSIPRIAPRDFRPKRSFGEARSQAGAWERVGQPKKSKREILHSVAVWGEIQDTCVKVRCRISCGRLQADCR